MSDRLLNAAELGIRMAAEVDPEDFKVLERGRAQSDGLEWSTEVATEVRVRFVVGEDVDDDEILALLTSRDDRVWRCEAATKLLLPKIYGALPLREELVGITGISNRHHDGWHDLPPFVRRSILNEPGAHPPLVLTKEHVPTFDQTVAAQLHQSLGQPLLVKVLLVGLVPFSLVRFGRCELTLRLYLVDLGHGLRRPAAREYERHDYEGHDDHGEYQPRDHVDQHTAAA